MRDTLFQKGFCLVCDEPTHNAPLQICLRCWSWGEEAIAKHHGAPRLGRLPGTGKINPDDLERHGFVLPRPLCMRCPNCTEQHVDHGEWVLRLHSTHLCEKCGAEWRPTTYPTIGVPVPL